MCFNSTTSILYDCNKNLTKKSIIIFVFSGLCIVIPLIFTLIFWFSKPIWLPEEIKRNNLRNYIEDKYTNNELINIDDDEQLINIDDDNLINIDDDNLINIDMV